MKYILLLLTFASLAFAGIGKITAINGKAYVVRGFSKFSLKQGSEIEKKDLIKTMQNTRLQIVFNDHTVISLGQKTEFKIDDYIFSKTKVKADFSVTKGIFKSITGRIGKIDHSKFKLRTKNATIGVRGTTFIGVVDEYKETIACTSGEIVVQNDKGTVFVKKNAMTTITDFQAPKRPKVIDFRFFKKVNDVKPQINSDNIVLKKVISTPETDNIKTENNVIEKENNTIGENIQVVREEVKDTVVQEYEQKITTPQEETSETVTQTEQPVETVTSGRDEVAEETNTPQEETSETVTQIEQPVETVTSGSDEVAEETSEIVTQIEQPVETVTSGSDEVTGGATTSQEEISETITSGSDEVTDGLSEVVTTISDVADTFQDTMESSNPLTSGDDDTTENSSETVQSDFGEEWTSDMTEQTDESTQSQDETQTETAQSDLDLLKDKVGGATSLHYEGHASGDSIVEDGNNVVLNVDLGNGSIDGNIKFKQEIDMGFTSVEKDWDTDVHGDFESGNRFSLEATSDGYSGNGHADLQGEHLETASGSMSLTKEQFFLDDQVDIDFVANGGAASGE